MENDSKIEVVNLTLTFLLYALEWPVLYQEPKLLHFLNIQSANRRIWVRYNIYQDPDNHPQIFQKFCQLAHIFLKEQKAHEPCQGLFRDRLGNPSDIFQQFVEPKSKLYPSNLLHLG